MNKKHWGATVAAPPEIIRSLGTENDVVADAIVIFIDVGIILNPAFGGK
jgi:hypothetical protein